MHMWQFEKSLFFNRDMQLDPLGHSLNRKVWPNIRPKPGPQPQLGINRCWVYNGFSEICMLLHSYTCKDIYTLCMIMHVYIFGYNTLITLHYTITLFFITLQYTTLHEITSHYITLRYITFHYIRLNKITSPYITLHYIT